jgi:hypothetical protein
MTTNTGKYSNLLQRPDKPALGRGRVQWGVKHALRHASEPITTGEAMKRAYSRRKRLGKPLADALCLHPSGAGPDRGSSWAWTGSWQAVVMAV